MRPLWTLTKKQEGPPVIKSTVIEELGQGNVSEAGTVFRSKRAGERVMKSVTRFATNTLHLRVNQQKSAVGQTTASADPDMHAQFKPQWRQNDRRVR